MGSIPRGHTNQVALKGRKCRVQPAVHFREVWVLRFRMGPAAWSMPSKLGGQADEPWKADREALRQGKVPILGTPQPRPQPLVFCVYPGED